MAQHTAIAGPAWDLSTEYSGPESAELENDLKRVGALLDEIEALNAALAAHERSEAVEAAQRVYQRSVTVEELLGNVTVYANCLLSVDSRDEAAQSLRGRLLGCQKRCAELLEPLSQFVNQASDEAIAAYLSDPAVHEAEFLVRHARRRRHERLPLAEEKLISALSQDGIDAWGRMYTQVSATMTCEVTAGGETRRLGLAQAGAMLQQPDEDIRRNAWRGINDAWERQEEACAAALNAIAGWRLEVCRKRSHAQPVHFLDAPVHENRIARDTLDALLTAADDARPLARRAVLALARASGRTQLGPWDLRAPAPTVGGDRAIPFSEALELIADAYGEIHPEMGEFVRLMGAKRWIEGTLGPRKRPGAYCTRFAKSRTPRVYMTYAGAPSDIVTLAHELGHAFHNWVMRDHLPASQRSYGMALAETASTFGEAAVRDALQRRARTDAQRLSYAWEDIAGIQTFLLNIPVRYSFEKTFYERRAETPLRPNELKRLMSEAWREWYGDVMCEADPMFWASKLHFFISGRSFYNFPYLFGYLFSMNLYLRKGEFDGDFYRRYVDLLCDTGRMTAEGLAAKHLAADLTQPAFWRDIVSRLEGRVAAFEALARAGSDAVVQRHRASQS